MEQKDFDGMVFYRQLTKAGLTNEQAFGIACAVNELVVPAARRSAVRGTSQPRARSSIGAKLALIWEFRQSALVGALWGVGIGLILAVVIAAEINLLRT